MKWKREEMSSHKSMNETWSRVKLKENMHNFVEPTAIVYYERDYEDELISVVTTYDVLQTDVPQPKHPARIPPKHYSTTFLIGISKKRATLPLFFECEASWSELRILRLSLGTAMNSGFMANEASRSAMLYHLFMKRSDEREGNEEAIAEYEQFEGLDSKRFSKLDARLQKGFREYLEVRGIDQPFLRDMIQETLQQKDRKCINFLRDIKRYFKVKEDDV